MNFTTEIDSENQMIEIKVACLLNQSIRKDILYAVALNINSSKFYKVLIDLTHSSFKKDEPITGALELTTFMKSIGIPQNAKLAFLFSEAEYHRKYFQETANTSGFNLRYFKSVDEAKAWLETG